ncbi:MAG TPA: 4Fe-4S binding protein [Candidatus Polarisedimenticolaceae bacterium]|nr:4Fe-4S binding protein [Candidatus Polarisedimenticolaceae bacterium]
MPVVRIDYDQCENTGACAMVCPEDVFQVDNGKTQVINQAACTLCWLCVDNCPSSAIELD